MPCGQLARHLPGDGPAPRGTVRAKLYKGNLITAGRKSPVSLYNPYVATMEADKGAYDQTDATGFIRLHALRLRTRASVMRKNK